MRNSWQPLGQGQAAGGSNSDLFWTCLALAGLLLAGLVAILWAKQWRVGLGQPRRTPDEEIAHYRALHAKGEISLEEFERITGIVRSRTAETGMTPPEIPPKASPG